jgi:HAD superfamily hydrolase (TIGR01509 family)
MDSIVNRMVYEVNQMVSEEIPWRPGARELLKSVADAGIPQVIVTMSYRTSAEFIANKIGLFAGLVTGDEVEHGKPHPQPFLLGAELVDVRAKDCVAIEDSGPGSQSAIAAGAVTIVVPLHVPLPTSPDYTIWQTLAGRTIQDVAKVFNEARA